MLLLKNATIRSMAKAGTFDGSVLIKDGKIAEVSNEIELPESAECEIIDVKHHLLMPGLIEAHCHMGITEEKKGQEGDDCNETVHPVTPMLRSIDAINTMDAAFSDAVRAGITSANIGPGSSNVVGGQFAVIKTCGRRIDDLILKMPSAMKVAFGENPKVNYMGMNTSPATRMAIAGMLRNELVNARQYLSDYEKNNTSYNLHYEAWRPVFEKKIPLKAHVHRVDDIFTAIRIAKEFDLRMTLDHCSEGHLIAEELAQEAYPAIVGPDFTTRNKIEVQNVAFKTAGILANAGVMVSITTDHPVSLIQSLPLCVGLSVKQGLSLEDGYRAMTINAAKMCGTDDCVGTIEKGKDADIAIFDGNPMETFTKTLMTIIDGKVVYRMKEYV
ncbi:MAG: amidohydrolase [Lachnospiraceae bacterium]|jgi:Imidazolonepropionase and related amidohydrolases|nr:amidohydrolase [Lachnospiraceae bacterium]